ncbi:ribosomal protein L17 [Coniophora puteana RWD-64-598 SS2]|uniref:Ribosomal protein L17 n=1 Tax=Coniophora puteana (strain RWD-64-598) TaxID=741705 RepID=A0A5M3N5P7_CONPW|nr:ribosomal protein L17 [Coniophora puteana RWD-64-598 SS2]EIW86636.1 ribosomal protein L17 [Coniophora puteana RWD-64-598 SS2]
MKHGVALRKFSRTSSHRDLMLRNLVCSLFEHEQIRTTLPKAKDTARLAEKVITLGKRKDLSSYQNARAFLLKPELMPKLFGQFADRYKERPGGYTRIHRLGSRQGDNAPMALVELVDNAHDLRVEMTARAIGRELLTDRLRQEAPRELAGKGIDDAHDILQREVMSDSSDNSQLRPKTKLNLQKVLKFNDSNFGVLSQKATAYMVSTPDFCLNSRFSTFCRVNYWQNLSSNDRSKPRTTRKTLLSPRRAKSQDRVYHPTVSEQEQLPWAKCSQRCVSPRVH